MGRLLCRLLVGGSRVFELHLLPILQCVCFIVKNLMVIVARSIPTNNPKHDYNPLKASSVRLYDAEPHPQWVRLSAIYLGWYSLICDITLSPNSTIVRTHVVSFCEVNISIMEGAIFDKSIRVLRMEYTDNLTSYSTSITLPLYLNLHARQH